MALLGEGAGVYPMTFGVPNDLGYVYPMTPANDLEHERTR